MKVYPDNDGSPASSVFSHDAQCQEPVDGHTDKRVEVLTIFPDPLGTLGALQLADDLAQGLEVLVIYTEAAGTLKALQTAEGLAQKLGAHIRLLLPYEVPYALPLTKPPVPVEFLERQVRSVASAVHLDVAAQVFLCRDKKRAMGLLLRPNSLVVMGGKKRWWPTPAQKMAQGLKKDGHHVIFAELR
jgi:hypothetical protein